MSDYKPITGELRGVMFITESEQGTPMVELGKYRFKQLCDAIDAIHAGLERENAALKAELDRVTGEQEEHAHARGESITDELRKYALGWDERNRVRCDLTAIADRIDAEHERECKEQYACGAEHGIGASIDASMIQTHGYVELPKDADGEYIHAGDVLDGYGKTIEVVELRHGRSGWVLISRDGNGYADTFAFSHHHKPTVEGILRDFGVDIAHALDADPDATVPEAIIAEYAAKLRLAGDAE